MNMDNQQIEFPWSVSGHQITGLLKVDPFVGLSTNEAQHRFTKYGPNELQKRSEKSAFDILLDQFKNLIIYLLILAAIISFLYGRLAESVAILVVLIINTLIGFFTEFRARKSMEALFRLGSVVTRVKRDGEIQQIHAEQLVPGDIVVIEGGDVIAADVRLLEASKLQADESVLTGESLPVSKHTKPAGQETVLPERKGMLFKGTSVTRGSGMGVV
ncbi:MAG: cation-transporting P-type ATPase, partial [Gammaproteobacteria bacterium]